MLVAHRVICLTELNLYQHATVGKVHRILIFKQIILIKSCQPLSSVYLADFEYKYLLVPDALVAAYSVCCYLLLLVTGNTVSTAIINRYTSRSYDACDFELVDGIQIAPNTQRRISAGSNCSAGSK